LKPQVSAPFETVSLAVVLWLWPWIALERSPRGGELIQVDLQAVAGAAAHHGGLERGLRAQ
jgi:hypothetical protein